MAYIQKKTIVMHAVTKCIFDWETAHKVGSVFFVGEFWFCLINWIYIYNLMWSNKV